VRGRPASLAERAGHFDVNWTGAECQCSLKFIVRGKRMKAAEAAAVTKGRLSPALKRGARLKKASILT
jgi:hypothetical protein